MRPRKFSCHTFLKMSSIRCCVLRIFSNSYQKKLFSFLDGKQTGGTILVSLSFEAYKCNFGRQTDYILQLEALGFLPRLN